MIAKSQYRLTAAELEPVLALTRAGTLAKAGALMAVDGSTVFRAVQRAEKALGQRLFDRSRAGYRATELGADLARHAERIEAELEAARAAAQGDAGAVSGTVRISTTDTILNGLLLPTLPDLLARHPHLRVDANATNEAANLSQRDADIALRATKRPPQHLIGRHLGAIRVAIHAGAASAPKSAKARERFIAEAPWIAVDEALPGHPSVLWRRRHLPKVTPRMLVNSIQSVFEGIAAGAGIGIVPLFLARGREDLARLSPPLEESATQLWLLTHPESRHLRRISTVAAHLAGAIRPA